MYGTILFYYPLLPSGERYAADNEGFQGEKPASVLLERTDEEEETSGSSTPPPPDSEDDPPPPLPPRNPTPHEGPTVIIVQEAGENAETVLPLGYYCFKERLLRGYVRREAITNRTT